LAFSPSRMAAELRIYARSNVRSREGFFFTLVFPIILILLFGAIFSGGGLGQATVYVQNLDGGVQPPNGTSVNIGAQLVAALNST